MTGVVYPTADLDRIWEDHGHPVEKLLSKWWEKNITRWGSSAKNGFREGAKTGIRYVLDLQHQVDQMSAGALLAELRKGDGSIYWPLYSENPKFWAVCPRCGKSVLITVQGICDECTYEFQETD